MDAEERLDGNLERLRELRAPLAAAETEQQRLQAREAELDARIVALELCTTGTIHLRDTPVENGVHTLRPGGHQANKGAAQCPTLLPTDVRRARLLDPANPGCRRVRPKPSRCR
jgi:hypothetical protein